MGRCSDMAGEIKPISKKMRFDVFKRDGFKCQYCGQTPPAVVLEVDHINPVSKGGKNFAHNLITACFNCNRGKAATPLTVIPKSLSEQAAEVKEREAQIAGYRKVMQASLDRIEADMWEVANTLIPNSGSDGLRRDWLQSIKGFNEKLPIHIVLDAAEKARAKFGYSKSKCFPYFCGICWNIIKEKGYGSR